MALVTRKVSDLSGKEGPEGDFCALVIRQHPKLDQPVIIDVLPEEIDGLKAAGDIVTLEVRKPDGTSEEKQVRLADFNKLSPNIDEVLQKAPGIRGRRPGYRPGTNGHGG